MTRIEAAAWKLTKAGHRSLDERAVMRCAERGEGCLVVQHDEWPKPVAAVEMPEHAGECVPCAKHQPFKRFAWLHDVAVEDVLTHFAVRGGPYDVNELRRYLPRKHLEWRAAL